MEKDEKDIIAQIGEFGYYQRIIVLTILAVKIPAALSMMMMAFGGTIPDWSCSNSSSNVTNICHINDTKCDRVYLTEWTTIINEWDLVCEKEWIGFVITSIQMAGVLIGSAATGYFSDIYGRKKSLYGSQLILISNIITIFSNSWQMFAALRFFIGIGIGGVVTVSFPLAMEFVGPKWRGILGAIPAFSLGALLIPLFLYFNPNWKYFHVINSVLCVLPIIGWFYVPESIRWLTVKGQIKAAEDIVFNLARKNNKPLPNTIVLTSIYQEEKSIREKRSRYSFFDLLKSKEMLKKTLILFFAWFSQSIAFYCIALGVQNLSGNLFLNMFLLTIVEMPSHLIVLFSANTLGRRWATALFYYLAGLLGLGATLSSLYAPNEYKGTIINACAMLANLCVGTSWTVIMVFTTEQYPTVIRNIGFGACNTVARLGAIFSAQIISLAREGEYLPYIIITVLMMISGSLVLLLNETKGTVLIDSLMKDEPFSPIYKPHPSNIVTSDRIVQESLLKNKL